MKTYLLDTINRIKRFSESLDVYTLLCNTPWVVFNDTGDKEVLIFQNDGSVLITNNGVGFKKTWGWVKANKSLTINLEDDTILMLHPKFVNKTILALEKDGTNQYSFLIDENNQQSFAPKTLSELQNYFEAIERKAIEAEEKKRIREEEEKKRKELEEKAEEILAGAHFAKSFLLCLSLISFVFALVAAKDKPIITAILMLVSFILLCLGIYIPIRKANRYKKQHPDDPVNEYLD